LQTWSDRRDSTGRPIFAEGIYPRVGGIRVAPKFDGGTNWWSPSYSPQTGLFYVTSHDATENYDLSQIAAKDIDYRASSVRAVNPLTGAIAWEFEPPLRLTSESGLLPGPSIRRQHQRRLLALDAATGETPWRVNLDGGFIRHPSRT
jgi:alcohol dehydrogenase (cytochrome c)